MDVERHAEWTRDVSTGTRLMSISGLALTALFLAGFGAWGAYAPLAGAAVASGVVAAAGQNQQIQHLEGGIIDRILVREGEVVKAGQVLFELDSTAAEAQRNRLTQEVVALAARIERLQAERDGEDALAFPQALVRRAEEKGFPHLLVEQEKEFSARLDRYRQETIIYQQRLNALLDQIAGMTYQQTAIERQLEVVQEEAARKKALLDRGLTDRSEYTALLRSEAELIGQLGQVRSSILGARTQMVEANEHLARLTTQRVETAASELNDVRTTLSSSEEQLRAASAVLDRVHVRAPADGIVIKTVSNTIGGVVKPGDILLELLPTSDELVVEARVDPQDVDVVVPGLLADLRFSALNVRTTPVVPGTVTYISADSFVDQATRQPYYVARIRITEDLPIEITRAQIYPGMPVETYIKTGERTFFDYLTRPVVDSFSRAFREE
ncbi:MAG TPA: HlyD family type I secretion periplasmic adaptor subunit [Aurantimonas sp.]|jgi:HlyD family type I secretion membrane fusion protein|nr:HlyD family type I secretion periplasmic adaptor subunit [Aurantimonas sp.]